MKAIDEVPFEAFSPSLSLSSPCLLIAPITNRGTNTLNIHRWMLNLNPSTRISLLAEVHRILLQFYLREKQLESNKNSLF